MSSATEEKLWIVCPICHKANPAGAQFCEHCWGAALHPDNALTTEELNEVTRHRQAYLKHKKRIKIAVISLSIMSVLLATFLGIYNLSDVIVKPSQSLNSNSLPGEWAMFHHDLGHSGSAEATSSIPQGTLKWSFQAGAPIHSSPAVANGLIYVGSQDSKFYALDANTGAKRWEYEAGSWVDSSPSVAKGVVYFGSNDGNLYALDAQTGLKKWDFKTTFPVRSAPAIAGDIVYFGSDDYSLYALNSATGKSIWDYDIHSPAESPPVVANGIVYIGAADGYTYGFNALTGQRRLRFRVHYPVYAGPVVTDTTVYAVTTNGRLYVFDGTVRTRLQEHEVKPFWTQLWLMVPGIPKPPEQSGYLWDLNLREARRGATGTVNTSPVVAGNTLYVGMDNKLVAVDLKERKTLWSFAATGTIRSSPALVNNIAYFGSDDGLLHAIDATSGKELWNFPTGGPITSSPAIVNGIVYVGSEDGNLYAIK